MRNALVTGASEGIGRAFAKRLARDGWAVTAVARNEARLRELVTELGAGHRYTVADLSDLQQTGKVCAELRGGDYNLLVNNAGIGVYGTFTKSPLVNLQKMTRLNCDALVMLSHAFLDKAKDGDALVNVASTLGMLPFPALPVYAATKAFVVSFSESLWFQEKPRGVHVMALCPGVTATGFQANAGGRERPRPPKSITQSPEEVVDVALAALYARKGPTVISGFPNKLLVFSTRLLSRTAAVRMMGRSSPS